MKRSNRLLRYDPRGVFLPRTGITPRQLSSLSSRLARIRDEVAVEDVRLLTVPEEIPDHKQPLDAAFLELPEHILDDYHERGGDSQLARILATAADLQRQVDRVVVLGIGGSYLGPRALMDACCQTYFNELTRAERGCRPRMYFEGNNLDNDSTRGLLQLLGNQPARNEDERWAIVVISNSGGTLETAVAYRQVLQALRQSCRGSGAEVGERIIAITGEDGRLRALAQSLGCRTVLPMPHGVEGRYSVLSAVGLLPGAILGLDVVRLLEGAATMNEHFRQTEPDDNIVLRFVGVCHLMEMLRGATTRVLSVWAKSLETVGLWYDQLLAESLGKDELGATPITTVNTRDLYSRAQQHQQGRRDKLITNLIVDHWREDPLLVGTSARDEDQLNRLANKSYSELMSAAIEGTNEAYRRDGRPTADIHLPAVDEFSLGQLLQMLMLATVVEGRLLGINPYGQPGVPMGITERER
jgi:glucose-6-phosphate isomerase